MKSAKGGRKAQVTAIKVLGFVIPFIIGWFLAWLIEKPPVHETDFVQGILTASSLLVGLSGVLLGIVRFPQHANIADKILVGTLKAMLILSLVLGMLTILFSLSWYAKGTSALLRCAVMSFGSQLGYVLMFLLFPKYYLK
jgi:hypothetical protein